MQMSGTRSTGATKLGRWPDSSKIWDCSARISYPRSEQLGCDECRTEDLYSKLVIILVSSEWLAGKPRAMQANTDTSISSDMLKDWDLEIQPALSEFLGTAEQLGGGVSFSTDLLPKCCLLQAFSTTNATCVQA